MRSKPYRQHLSSSEHLVTPYTETRAGFVAVALEKNRRSTPTVAEARALKVAASKAKAALERIREAFRGKSLAPKTFSVGAAIERSMAAEIWGQLETGSMDNAANLTNEDQMASLCRWLCNL